MSPIDHTYIREHAHTKVFCRQLFFVATFPGVLVNLHHAYSKTGGDLPVFDNPVGGGGSGGGRKCGVINTGVLQQVVAAKWALEVINNQQQAEAEAEEGRAGRRTGRRNQSGNNNNNSKIGRKKIEIWILYFCIFLGKSAWPRSCLS